MNRVQQLLPRIKEYIVLKDLKKTFGLLKPFVLKRWKAYLILLLLLFIDIFLTVAFASFFGKIADAAVRADFEEIKSLIPIALTLVVISITFSFADIYFETVATNGVKRDIKDYLFSHILRLPTNRFSQMKSGEVLTYFSNDVHNLDGVIGSSLINLIRLPLIFLVVFIYLLQLNMTMSLLTLLATPFAIIAGAVFGVLLRRNSRKLNILFEKVNEHLSETFQGISVIRSFTLEMRSYQEFSSYNEELYQLELTNAKLRGFFSSGGNLLSAGSYYISLLLGAYFVSEGSMTVGALLTFQSLVGYLVSPMTRLAGQWAGFQRSLTSVERILNVTEEKAESPRLPSYTSGESLSHAMELQEITFSYNESTQVFNELQLSIPANKVIALVGPSGAGKSTLFNLLQGFYQPQKGDILFDGVSIKEMTVSKLRSTIASVPQETFLFAGSIRENLMLARPGITEQEMIHAAQDACIHDYIQTLPNGYGTEIGERGIKLSGGQKQRIAIARAILKDAPILLLDEATSALDTETEYYVKEALNSLKKNRTTLVIAHRLSTIESADLILVMDQGKIVQQGTHEELINQPGLYQTLSRTKFKPKVELSLA
ncbi:ABC transporter ATP-binding protein [Robertmurraya beringensis]|uniref:ABC transporter ATP-binding protein n=1 Tax=Robertmurraya beringensis TaxID=641660 RepID=A0ABV6KVV6_9BACI